jgi:hypothetical protein
MKNKYLYGLLTLTVLFALGYGVFQIYRHMKLTNYYVEQFEEAYFNNLYASKKYRDEYIQSSWFKEKEKQMYEEGYNRAEIDELGQKAYRKAYTRKLKEEASDLDNERIIIAAEKAGLVTARERCL